MRLRKTRYRGHDFGTHLEVVFIGECRHIIGKFENVDEQKVVQQEWVQQFKWEKEWLEDVSLCKLEQDE